VRATLKKRYGASPLHLISLLASFAVAGAAVVGWFQRPRDVASVLEWFGAAIVLHDLVLTPLYSLVDRITIGWLHRRVTRDQPAAARAVGPAPYLRVPAIVSGLLLAVFFPVIFGLGARTELVASGIPERAYLARWLLLTGSVFALSGVAYAVALARARAHRDPSQPSRAGDRTRSGHGA
jgi:hypothetical protein